MAADKQAARAYEFGQFHLDVAERLLLRDGEPVPLAPKVFDTLVALVEQGGHLVTKDEMMSKLWPDTFVEEATLARNISDLRKTLGEPPDAPRYIETVPRHGYRFAVPVRRLSEEAVSLIVEKHTQPRTLIEAGEETNGSVAAAPFIQAEALKPTFSSKLSLTSSEKVVATRLPGGPLSKLRLKRLGRTLLLATGLAFSALLAYLYLARSNEGQRAPIGSIAVLLLKNLSDDPAQEYYSDGLTESLITALSQIERLKVISRSSAFRFKGKEVDPRELGRQLGVASVLEGNVRKDGDSVRVAVRLVSVEDGRVLWASDSYDRALADVFALQDEIARNVAAGLRVKLSGAGEQRLARRDTSNVEAYQLYLIGKYHLNKRTEAGFKRGIEYFEQALAKDPRYALAYAGLADCHALISPYSFYPPQESYRKAKAAAAKALELDEQLAEAHTSLANLTWLYEWDWPKAEREFKRALELNPNYPTAHQWYAACLSSLGRHEEAIREAQRALELDPLSLSIIRDLTRCFYHARQYDEAIRQYQRLFELEPNHYRLNSWLDLAYEQKGLYDQAMELRLKAMTVIKVNPATIETLKKAYAESGWQGYWRKELELAEERLRQKQKYLTPAYNMARICARLGEKEQTLKWLEKAYDERSDHLVLLKVDPLFDNLRTDPRFTNLLRRVGLAP